MKNIKFVAISLACLFVIASTVPPANAQDIQPPTKPPSPEKLFDKIAVAILYNVYMMGVPWYVFRFIEPDVFTAKPNTIDADLLGKTSITIGSISQSSGDYKSLKDDFELNSLFTGTDFEFSLELPDYLPKDAIIARFDPQNLSAGKEGQLKTTLTFLYNKIPSDIALPENIVLRVNVTRYTTAGNLYLPAKGKRGIYPFCFLTGKMGVGFWFLSAIGLFGFPFGPLYSGKRTVEYSTYLDIIVNLNQTHIIEMVPPQDIRLEPDKTYSIPIKVKNLGNYVDSFNFRVSTSDDSGLLISPPPAITLSPNEEGYANLGIVTSEDFWDPGTLHSIKIDAYSIYNPDKVSSNSVILVTGGVHVSTGGAIYSIVILFVLILVIIVFFYIRRKTFEKILIKPDKPWEIPEEKKYLEKLKEKDEKQYKKVLEMMEQEYESALLWYKYYVNAAVRKRKTDKEIVEKLKTSREKTAETIKEKPEIVKKEEKPSVVSIDAEREKLRKEQAILKIIKQQEKQKRKLT